MDPCDALPHAFTSCREADAQCDKLHGQACRSTIASIINLIRPTTVARQFVTLSVRICRTQLTTVHSATIDMWRNVLKVQSLGQSSTGSTLILEVSKFRYNTA